MSCQTNKTMEPLEKIGLISKFMHFEPAEDHCSMPPPDARLSSERSVVDQPGLVDCVTGTTAAQNTICSGEKDANLGIFKAVLPGGKHLPLLKTLLTSACERDCYYCVFRQGNDHRRVTFKPDEMAQAFMKLYQAGRAQGLFLSSGIAGGGSRTQDRLIATAEILRLKMRFRGYLHLKIMPGAEKAQVERAMQLADRVSINLEAPNTARLERLAPHKSFLDELVEPLRWVDQIRRSQPERFGWNGHWPSSTTQFVVGAVGETDLELLSTTETLYRQHQLKRAYFSGFAPVEGTPLENQPAIHPWRQHRLYQASFLLRDYGFTVEDLPFSTQGDLPLGEDPKLAWARSTLMHQPFEINKARPDELIRVPGIGPKSVQQILRYRRQGKINSLSDLLQAGVQVNRAAPFLLINGTRPPQQLKLF